jgi:hypothetical protein
MSFLKKCKKFVNSKCLCCQNSYHKDFDNSRISNKDKIKIVENNLEIALSKINILEKEIDLLKQNNQDNYRKFSESHEDISKKFEELENKTKDAEFVTVNISKENMIETKSEE